MKNRLRRVTAALLMLCVFALCPFAGARAALGSEQTRDFTYEGDFETESLGAVIERYLDEKKIGEHNIAIGWYDLESGEEWYYGADQYIYGASTYKLPLAMLYADMIEDGEISPDKQLGSYPLEEDLHRMVANSDNNVADVLKDALGLDADELSRQLARYSGLDVEELPQAYYGGAFSPRFLIGTLRTLYDNSDKYSQILEFMKEARPDSFLSLYRGKIEVAHKYGSIPRYLCDSGIVYTERPFLLTVLTHDVGVGMTVIGEIGAIAMDYAAYLAQKPEPTPTPTPEPTPEPTPAPTPLPSPEPMPPQAETHSGVPIAAAIVLALGATGAVLAYRKKKK